MLHAGTPRRQRLRKPRRACGGDDRVARTRHDQDRPPCKIGARRLIERERGAQQDAAGERFGSQQQHCRRDIGAVRIAERDRRGDTVVLARRRNEVGEIVGAPAHVVLVEHAFRQAAEEPRHAALQHLAARRQQRGAGRDRVAQRNEIVLVAAGAVQQEQRRRSRPIAGFEAVDELRRLVHQAAASSGGSAFSI